MLEIIKNKKVIDGPLSYFHLKIILQKILPNFHFAINTLIFGPSQFHVEIAQLVDRRPHNLKVPGSIP